MVNRERMQIKRYFKREMFLKRARKTNNLRRNPFGRYFRRFWPVRLTPRKGNLLCRQESKPATE